MTTLDSLGGAEPEPAEVAHAALAMADYDAKAGDYPAALDWLAVAAQYRELTPEYRDKKAAWEASVAQRHAPAASAETRGCPAPRARRTLERRRPRSRRAR